MVFCKVPDVLVRLSHFVAVRQQWVRRLGRRKMHRLQIAERLMRPGQRLNMGLVSAARTPTPEEHWQVLSRCPRVPALDSATAGTRLTHRLMTLTCVVLVLRQQHAGVATVRAEKHVHIHAVVWAALVVHAASFAATARTAHVRARTRSNIRTGAALRLHQRRQNKLPEALDQSKHAANELQNAARRHICRRARRSVRALLCCRGATARR